MFVWKYYQEVRKWTRDPRYDTDGYYEFDLPADLRKRIERALTQSQLETDLGVSAEDLKESLRLLMGKGLEQSEAVQVIRHFLSIILRPDEKAKRVASGLDIKLGEDALARGRLPAMLSDVLKATNGSEAAIELFFGKKFVGALRKA